MIVMPPRRRYNTLGALNLLANGIMVLPSLPTGGAVGCLAGAATWLEAASGFSYR